MRFDPSKPHGIVYGEPGVSWHQNGRHYKKDGTPVGEEAEPVAEVAPVAVTVVAPRRPADKSIPTKQADVLRQIYERDE